MLGGDTAAVSGGASGVEEEDRKVGKVKVMVGEGSGRWEQEGEREAYAVK